MSVQRRGPSRHALLLALALGPAVVPLARAQDVVSLRQGADPAQVSVSGLSSGAAMALQYAIAHSGSVTGVGSIAGPAWDCAEGSLALGIRDCMTQGGAPVAKPGIARRLAAAGKIDPLPGNNTTALKRSFVFQSGADKIVNPNSGQANVDLLAALTGVAPVFDRGHADGGGSDTAAHGILSPQGKDSCDGAGSTFVRRCGGEDNALEILSTIFGGERPGPGERKTVADADVRPFDQQVLIDDVKKGGAAVSGDTVWMFQALSSAERQNFDMAPTGYIFVPGAVCGKDKPPCRVHVALHGCSQKADVFARDAGYNNWAAHYRAIIVYPAVKARTPWPWDWFFGAEPNPLGCWDWWGYLDRGIGDDRYLTKAAPQMKVIERIVAEVTKAVP